MPCTNNTHTLSHTLTAAAAAPQRGPVLHRRRRDKLLPLLHLAKAVICGSDFGSATDAAGTGDGGGEKTPACSANPPIRQLRPGRGAVQSASGSLIQSSGWFPRVGRCQGGGAKVGKHSQVEVMRGSCRTLVLPDGADLRVSSESQRGFGSDERLSNKARHPPPPPPPPLDQRPTSKSPTWQDIRMAA